MDTEIPTQVISLSMEVESNQMTIKHESSQDVLCDFVDGLAFGEAMGIGFRSTTWSTVTRVVSQHSASVYKSLLDSSADFTSQEIQLELKQPIEVAPSQVRIVPLIILQNKIFCSDSLDVVVTVAYGSGQELEIVIGLPITQRSSAEASEHVAFRATYLYNSTMPTAFLAIPPVEHPRRGSPPILALRKYIVPLMDPAHPGLTRWRRSRHNHKIFLA